jgi:hypothetical protein
MIESCVVGMEGAVPWSLFDEAKVQDFLIFNSKFKCQWSMATSPSFYNCRPAHEVRQHRTSPD